MSESAEVPQTREASAGETEVFRRLLAEAIKIVEDEGCPYVVAGSIASAYWGRPASVGDVDLVIDPTDAKRLLKRFDTESFETEETNPQWLYKATKYGKTVDLIFEMEGPFYLDDPMIDHSVIDEVEGTRLRVMSAEDFVLSQAMAFEEDRKDYWFNALGVLSTASIDWDYLVERASRGPRRTLSLMLFAQSKDLAIPDSAIRSLFEATYGH
jgi:predicted nucleotidyltransferase